MCDTMYAGPAAPYRADLRTAATGTNWTGFYLGGFAGYTRAQADPQLNLGGGFSQIPPVITNGLESRGSESFDFDGGELGGLLGFNYQVGPVVLGLESAGGYLWSRESRDTGPIIFGEGVPPLDIRSSLKTHYLLTIAPRIGIAFGRFLPYVTGGLALGDSEWSQTLLDLADPATHAGGRSSETNAGWMVGGGLEYIMTDHWHARAQYQYVDLGSVAFDSHVTTSADFLTHHSASLTEHHATFALIFKF